MSGQNSTYQPLGLWFKPLWKVEVMPSVVDPRKVIEVHADEDWMAVDAAECAGYRAYSAQPAQQPTNYVFTTGV